MNADLAAPNSSTPLTPPPPGPSTWKTDLGSSFRRPADLLAFLQIPLENNPISSTFSTLVPRFLAEKIEKGNPQDPILLQVLPRSAETKDLPGFHADPVEDSQAALQPGLLRKYSSRVLLVTTGACAVHCRYCFRREYPYGALPKNPENLLQLARDAGEACEVGGEIIFSGGDPFLLEDALLLEMCSLALASGNAQRLRFHTRVPTVLPSRFHPELLRQLALLPVPWVLVSHVNHPRELCETTAMVFAQLKTAGALLLNQSVLLRGINDNSTTLLELSQRLVAQGVVPYYLHQLDRVRGAAHFEVPVAQGQALMEELRNRAPGYLVPRYVQEIAGAPGKTPL